MKFTSEDLMKAMGLSVGDRVRLNKRIYEVEKGEDDVYFNSVDDGIKEPLYNVIILYTDYEILPIPKRVGDLECDSDCNNCPLRILPSCKGCGIKTLYKILEVYKTTSKYDGYFDQEIYDLLKTRLDKEVTNAYNL